VLLDEADRGPRRCSAYPAAGFDQGDLAPPGELLFERV
jgi:hypothetical protein